MGLERPSRTVLPLLYYLFIMGCRPLLPLDHLFSETSHLMLTIHVWQTRPSRLDHPPSHLACITIYTLAPLPPTRHIHLMRGPRTL